MTGRTEGDPLDRLEAIVSRDRERGITKGMYWAEDFAALVAVARAARDFLLDDDVRAPWDDCVCSYCVRHRELRAALTRLEEPR